MATANDSVPHVVRTANDPRQTGLYNATLSKIDQINSKIRLLRLSLQRDGPLPRHLPGQYVDLHIPNIPTVGGFTITSPPSTALPSQESPYIELAIQRSPTNPPAAFLWRPPAEILLAALQLRIGGAFVHPPTTLTLSQCQNIDRVVLIAGGVGINPIMSMVSALHELGVRGKVGGLGMPRCIRVLYGTKREQDQAVLFEERLRGVAEFWMERNEVDFGLKMFETGGDLNEVEHGGDKSSVQYVRRRINTSDLLEALGPEPERSNAVAYVCGIPTMTDEFVEFMQKAKGMDEMRVMCEKWW